MVGDTPPGPPSGVNPPPPLPWLLSTVCGWHWGEEGRGRGGGGGGGYAVLFRRFDPRARQQIFFF